MTNTINAKTIEATYKALDKLAVADANGALCKPKIGLTLATDARDGAITPDDAEALYDRYKEKRRAELAKNNRLADDKPDSKQGRAANISKNVQLITCAILPNVDGVATLENMLDARLEMSGSDTVWPAFESMVIAARAQLKSPDVQLTMDELRTLCVKPEAKEKDLIAKLVEDYKRMTKRHDEFPCQAIEAAVHAIGDAIQEAGGELPAMTKEEKAKAAFVTKARAMGLSVIAH